MKKFYIIILVLLTNLLFSQGSFSRNMSTDITFKIENVINDYFAINPLLHKKQNETSDNVDLLFPKENDSNQPLSLNFEWTAIGNSNSFILQISKVADFSTLDYNKLVTGASSRIVSQLSHSTQYFWRVKAIDPNYNGEWSSVWNFRTVEDANNQILIEKIKQNGLHILEINTVDNEIIYSKEEYIKGKAIIHDNLNGNYQNVDLGELEIKGRGNTTWNFPKKPYRIKLSDSKVVLGMPENKHWVLLANYSDKSLLRTTTAFKLSRYLELEYTPREKTVEFVLNGAYQGTYQLVEAIKIAKDRVDITKINSDENGIYGGVILEVDARRNEVHNFDTEKGVVFNVKDPDDLNTEDPEETEKRFKYVVDKVTEAEEALFSDNFKDEETGYAKYFDVNSFINWYLVNEILKNHDAVFFSSVFMHFDHEKKITIGPVWDFDISAGNINYHGGEDPEGLWIKPNTGWILRFFQDPQFENALYERWEEVREEVMELLESNITENARHLKKSQTDNFELWPILGTYIWPNFYIGDTYEEEVFYLKQWLTHRMAWMDSQFSDNPMIVSPLSNDASYTIIQDRTLEGKLLGFHPNSPIEFILTSETQKGIFELDAISGDFKYIPNEGYSGKDSISFVTQTSNKISQESFIYINIIGNKPPTAILLGNSSIIEYSPEGSLVGELYSEDEDVEDVHNFSFASGEGDDDNSSFTIIDNKLISNEIFNYLIKDSYFVRIKTEDKANLTYEESFVINVLPEIILGDNEKDLKSISFVYPNPANDIITLNLDSSEVYDVNQIEVISSTGALYNLPLSEEIHEGILSFDVSSLKTGLYLLKIVHKNGTKSLKFIISR